MEGRDRNQQKISVRVNDLRSLIRLESLDKLIQDHPVLAMITNMTENKKSDRLDVNQLNESIGNAKDSRIPVLDPELFNKIEKIINEDMKDMKSFEQMQLYFESKDPNDPKKENLKYIDLA